MLVRQDVGIEQGKEARGRGHITIQGIWKEETAENNLTWSEDECQEPSVLVLAAGCYS